MASVWVWLILGTALTTLAPRLSLAGTPRTEAPRGLVVSLPDVTPRLRQIAMAGRPDAMGAAAAFDMSATSPQIVESLRRRVLREMVGETPGCEGEAGVVSQMLEEAGNDVDLLRLDAAEQTLLALRRALPCAREVVHREQLTRLFLLQGVAGIYGGGDDGGHIGEALAVDPDLAAPADYSQAVRQRYAAEVANMAERPLVQVTLPVPPAPFVLFLDGRPVTNSTEDLAPGPHLLQWTVAEEGVVAGEIVWITQDDASRGTVTGSGMKLPTTSDLLEVLRVLVSRGSMDPDLERLMGALSKEGGYQWVVLIVGSPDGHGTYALWRDVTGTTVATQARCEGVVACGGRSSIATVLVDGLATVAVASTALYVGAWRRASNPDPQVAAISEEGAQRLVLAQEVGRGVAVGATVSAAVLGSWNWRTPTSFYLRVRPAPSSFGAGGSRATMEPSVGMRMSW